MFACAAREAPRTTSRPPGRSAPIDCCQVPTESRTTAKPRPPGDSSRAACGHDGSPYRTPAAAPSSRDRLTLSGEDEVTTTVHPTAEASETAIVATPPPAPRTSSDPPGASRARENSAGE